MLFRGATVALMILVNNPGSWDQLLALIRINGGIGMDGKPVYLTPFNWFYENVCKQIFQSPNWVSCLCSLFYYNDVVFCMDTWIKRKFTLRCNINSLVPSDVSTIYASGVISKCCWYSLLVSSNK